MGKNETNKLVVADVGWARDIPDWLMEEVKTERLVEGFASTAAPKRPASGKVGLAETCVYLYTASLSHPLNPDYAQIYFWVVGRLMEKKGAEPPYFVRDVLKMGLNADQQRKLDRLRRELYEKRGGEIRSPLINALKAVRKEIFGE